VLDSTTKKRIDDIRNILVAKTPSPQSQVEQITTALIYKFMYDMDEEAVEMGGVPSFFVGDYEKYSWKNLFDSKLGGTEKVQLYSDAIENMYTNPTAPPLFKEIFKDAYLPFKDPKILNMFLKEINEFSYSDSEILGDAYEYLVSFLGSQGDAGQFRTPRHIIDFIVEIVSPQKNETILDPACGTAGFLISSYKHILNQNTGEKQGDRLTAADRKEISNNLVGYDLDPTFVKISLVNLHLHEFTNPKIDEYDTLSSEDKWNEYFDVILANPPFFSPKGGIQPHSRFGVQSTRAEVLFVDYIMEHLKPNGRAGIVVPEGIIFQTGTAYKTLRKKLVEDCLVGVISLPAGVFQPYSGVKTSILILDKELNQKSESIFFAKVENDGFSLGAQRTSIAENDLPPLVSAIQSGNGDGLFLVSKETILSNTSVSLSQSNYVTTEELVTDYPMVKIGDLFTTSSGGTPKAKEKKYYDNGTIPWIRSGEVDGKLVLESEINITELGLKESSAKLFPINSILVAMYGATAGKVGILGIEAATNQAVCAIFPSDKCLPKYLYYLLRSREETLVGLSVGGAQPNISQTIIKDFKIPLPPIEVQQEIVDELEGYQKIIDGCRQVVENYKPTIDIDPSWEMVEIGDLVAENLDSKRVPITKGDRKVGDIPYYGASGIVDYVEGHLFDEDLLLVSEDGANLKDRNYPIAFSITGKTWVNNHAHVLKFSDMHMQKFIECYFNQISVEPYLTGAAQPKLNQSTLNKISIPVPSNEEIGALIESIEREIVAVDGNKKLIEIYTQKIQDRIDKVWGD